MPQRMSPARQVVADAGNLLDQVLAGRIVPAVNGVRVVSHGGILPDRVGDGLCRLEGGYRGGLRARAAGGAASAAVTLPMALTAAEKQRRYRERQSAPTSSRPDLIEQALLQEVERGKRGELSIEERAALADELADAAMRHQRRAQELAEIARKLRPPGWNPPHAPR